MAWPRWLAQALHENEGRDGPLYCLEWFLLLNLALLGVDILMAHAVNAFAHPMEWAPVIYSALGTVVLVAARLLGGPLPDTANPVDKARGLARLLGLLVGAGAMVMGVAGLVFHLRSAFFVEQTLHNLVYAAPFAAPLAYVGVGLLLVLDRKVARDDVEWSAWVILLALGGFLGNFALSLTDHAINGFYHPAEWAGVVAGALGVGVLAGALAAPDDAGTRRLAVVVMVLQIGVGVVGTGMHLAANLGKVPGQGLERFLYGTPTFAPMLFADVALIALIGLWARGQVETARPEDGG